MSPSPELFSSSGKSSSPRKTYPETSLAGKHSSSDTFLATKLSSEDEFSISTSTSEDKSSTILSSPVDLFITESSSTTSTTDDNSDLGKSGNEEKQYKDTVKFSETFGKNFSVDGSSTRQDPGSSSISSVTGMTESMPAVNGSSSISQNESGSVKRKADDLSEEPSTVKRIVETISTRIIEASRSSTSEESSSETKKQLLSFDSWDSDEESDDDDEDDDGMVLRIDESGSEEDAKMTKPPVKKSSKKPESSGIAPQTVGVGQGKQSGQMSRDALRTDDGVLLHKAVVSDSGGGLMMELQTALNLGELYRSGQYDADSGMLRVGSEEVDLMTAIENGVVDRDSVRIIDPLTGGAMTLTDACDRCVLNPETATMTDDATGDTATLTQAVEQYLLRRAATDGSGEMRTAGTGKNESGAERSVGTVEGGKMSPEQPEGVEMSLVDAVRSGLYEGGVVRHPATGQTMSIAAALDCGLIGVHGVVLRDAGRQVALAELVETGLVDFAAGTVRDGHGAAVPLDVAVRRGMLCHAATRTTPMSLLQILDAGLYDEITGEFTHPWSGECVSLAELLASGALDSASVVVNDAGSGDVLSLTEAVSARLVDVSTARVRDTCAHVHVTLTQALHAGILIPRPMPLRTAVEIGLYNEVTAMFLDPTCRRFFNLEDAIEYGLIDAQSTVVDAASGREMSLALATACGVLDAKHGNVINVHTGEVVPLKLAFAMPQPKVTHGPGSYPVTGTSTDVATARTAVLTLAQAMEKGLYDGKSNMLRDPLSGAWISLDEALKDGVIDAESPVVEPHSGDVISLRDAIESGIVDTNMGIVIDTANGSEISFEEAYRRDLFVAADSAADVRMSVMEAIDAGRLDAEATAVTIPGTTGTVSLAEAIDAGIVDGVAGTLTNPQLGTTVPLVEALRTAHSQRRREEEEEGSEGAALLATGKSGKTRGVETAATEVISKSQTSKMSRIDGEQFRFDEAIEVGLSFLTKSPDRKSNSSRIVDSVAVDGASTICSSLKRDIGFAASSDERDAPRSTVVLDTELGKTFGATSVSITEKRNTEASDKLATSKTTEVGQGDGDASRRSMDKTPNAGQGDGDASRRSTDKTPNAGQGDSDASRRSVDKTPNAGQGDGNASRRTADKTPNAGQGSGDASRRSADKTPNAGQGDGDASRRSTDRTPNAGQGDGDASRRSADRTPNAGQGDGDASRRSTVRTPNAGQGDGDASRRSTDKTPNTGQGDGDASRRSADKTPNAGQGDGDASRRSTDKTPNTGQGDGDASRRSADKTPNAGQGDGDASRRSADRTPNAGQGDGDASRRSADKTPNAGPRSGDASRRSTDKTPNAGQGDGDASRRSVDKTPNAGQGDGDASRRSADKTPNAGQGDGDASRRSVDKTPNAGQGDGDASRRSADKTPNAGQGDGDAPRRSTDKTVFAKQLTDIYREGGAMLTGEAETVDTQAMDSGHGTETVGSRLGADTTGGRLAADAKGSRLGADATGGRHGAVATGGRLDADATGSGTAQWACDTLVANFAEQVTQMEMLPEDLLLQDIVEDFTSVEKVSLVLPSPPVVYKTVHSRGDCT